jgi:DNA-binding XRE family transcriptional regulator
MNRRPGQRPGYQPHGEEIRRLRVRVHGLKRAELAVKVGYSTDSIKSAELGNPISELLASRIARALGVEVEDIATPPGDDEDVSEPETPDRISA